jgi:ATP-dependent Lon protease
MIPDRNDLYEVGTIGTILQLLKLPDGTVKVLVEGGPSVCVLRVYRGRKVLSGSGNVEMSDDDACERRDGSPEPRCDERSSSSM